MSIKDLKVVHFGSIDAFASDPIDGVARDTRIDGTTGANFDAATAGAIPPAGEILGTVSDVVGLTSTFMGMTGLEIPGLGSIFGGGGPDWSAIEQKVDDIDNKMTEMLQIGNDLKAGLGEVGDKIDATFLASVQGHVLNARGDLSNYVAATTTHDQNLYRDGALSESQSAINLVTNYFQSGGTDASDPGKDIGVILGATLMRIATVEEFDDGAFAKPTYKAELSAAADLLDQSANALAPLITSRELVTNPQGFDSTFTNATGTERTYHLSVSTAKYSDAYHNGGIMGLLAEFESLTINDFQGIGHNPAAEIAEIHNAIDVIEAGIAEDAQSFQLAVFHATADGWRTLVAGQYLAGNDGHDDVINDATSGTRDTLSGLGGNDTLVAGSQNSALLGGDGNDVIIGNNGSDRIDGGAGNDLLHGGLGDDRMDGGAGNDTASYDDDLDYPGVHIDLTQNGVQDTVGAGLDTLTNIENVIGSQWDDVLIGNDAANVLNGGDGINTLQGAGGDDTLIGGIGQDTFEGGAGDDLLIIEQRSYDTVHGGAGTDTATFASVNGGVTVQLNGTNDVGFTLSSNDTQGVIGGVENVIGGMGDDAITGDSRANVLIGGSGADQLKGGAGNDTLYGDDKTTTKLDDADTLSGGAGDDVFARTSAGAGVDTLTGGTGRDTYQLAWNAGAAADVVTDFLAGAGGDYIDISHFGNDGTDGFASGFLRIVQVGDDALLQCKVNGSYQNVLILQDTLTSNLIAGNFTPNGHFTPVTGGPTDGNDTLTGTAAADAISGFDGDDTLNGSGGGDVLKGENGDDHLNGGAGNDVLDGGLGKDTIVGGAGVDTVTYAARTADIHVTLEGDTAVGVFVRNSGGILVAEDKLSQVENVAGGLGNDRITGDVLDNRLSGGAGADTLSGGGGNDLLDGGDGIDTAVYASAAKHVVVSLAIGGAQNTIGAGSDTLIGIENLTGSAFNDTLTGDGGANTLIGGAGNDTLDGGLGADILIGGGGIDTVNYAAETRAIHLTLHGNTPAAVSFGSAFTVEDSISGIENVTAGSGDDQITGDKLANVLIGGSGADVLSGGGGNDILYGDDKSSPADGADTLIGGAGDDRFMRVSAGNGIDRLTGGGGSDTYGLAFASGNAADIVTDFKGGAGGDVIDLTGFGASAHGGFTTGFLRVVQQGTDVAIQIEIHPGNSSAYQTALLLANFSAATLTAANFSADSGFVAGSALFIGTGGNDVFTGTPAGETIDGRGGDDIIRGGGGNDTIIGGAGFDTADYRDKTQAVVVTLTGDTAATVHVGSHAEDTVAGIEAIYGGAGEDVLTGDGLDNLFRGGGGNDTLDGGAGTDTADYRDKSDAIAVTLNGATPATVTIGTQAEDTLANIENVYGGAGADRLTGDSRDNLFRGGDGHDVLNGAGGFDIADYSDKTANVSVTLAGAAVATVFVGGVAEDKIHNFEGIIGGSGADTLTGNAHVNHLFGGDGDDVLAGGGGKDLLDGGAGHDIADYSAEANAISVMLNGANDARVHVGGVADALLRNIEEVRGGAGDDILSGRGGVTLDGGAGNNLLDYGTAATGIHVSLNGASDSQVWFGDTLAATVRNIENVDGGSGADFIAGDGLANTLDGNDGDDTLSGGGGNDVLNGGDGTDVADFSYTSAVVTVNALSSSSDTTVFVGDLGDADTIDIVTLKSVEGIIGGSGDDTLTGGDAGHLLSGGDGSDNLTGGAGHDTLIGGAGADTMLGGAGADTFVFGPSDLDTVDYMDFNPGEGDKIDLHAFGLTADPTVSQGTDGFGLPCLTIDLHNDGSQILTIEIQQTASGNPNDWFVL